MSDDGEFDDDQAPLYKGDLSSSKLQPPLLFSNFAVLLQRGRITRSWAEFIANKVPVEIAHPLIRDTLDDLLMVNRDKGEFIAWNKELVARDKYKANSYLRRAVMKIIITNQLPKKLYATIYDLLSLKEISDFIVSMGV